MTAALPPYHLSVDEFFAFCNTDPARYERFELVLGQIQEPTMESVRHARMVQAIHAFVRDAEPEKEIFMGGSVTLDGDGHVFPDVYVVRPSSEPDGDYWNGRDLSAVVEVSLTSWAIDSGPKLRNYALGGVPTYFVVKMQDELTPVVYCWVLGENGEYGDPEILDISFLLGPSTPT